MLPANRWFAGETYLKAAGRWTSLYRAVDQHGQVTGVLLPVRRDLAAARRLVTRAARRHGPGRGHDRPGPLFTCGSPASRFPQRYTLLRRTRTTRSRQTTGG